MSDEFFTLGGASEGYYMDRGSKFIAYAAPVPGELEANQFLQKIKKEHPKARHYCTAIRLFPDASLERSNDDGEPSGSAGKPILGQLVKHQLTNAMIIVVRYFGGTKLGVPGLIEAYKTSASNAISKGAIVKRKVYATAKVNLSYEQLPTFINHCKQSDVMIIKEEYGDSPTLFLGFSRSSIHEELKETLHTFSQMDFENVEDYAQHLNMMIEIQNEEKII